MKKPLIKRVLWVVLALLGLLYLFLIHIQIIKQDNQHFILYSKINQTVKLHIQLEYKQSKMRCNDTPIVLDNGKKHDYFYHGQEEIMVPLYRGENLCKIEHMKSKIRQKIGFLDFIILFILLGIPIFQGLFFLVMKLMDKVKKFNTQHLGTRTLSSIKSDNNSLLFKLILLIGGLGVIIRVAYFERFGVMVFQHDWQGHIEFIQYVAQHGSLPAIPMKGWEFPQQPLYYIITGGIYGGLTHLGLNHQEALLGIGSFSLVISIVSLFYSYLLLKLLTQKEWVILVAMIFLSLTPSVVYLSARINNDSLVMGLSVVALYYIVKSYQHHFRDYFYVALVMVSLLFLTKISTAGVELLFFGLLLVTYYHAPKEEEKHLKKMLYTYALVGVFVLGITLLRVYMPIEDGGVFYMVNSAKFPKQTLESLDFSYFASFHIVDLVTVGQSHVFGVDSIRHSFLTYQYGTMFFGESDYTFFVDRASWIHPVMQSILFLGLIYLLGFLVYLIQLRREPLLYKILFTILSINFILILKFMWMYPSICNTDFRYFVGSFTLLAFVFARGLEYLSFTVVLKKIISGLLGLLVVSELLFFYLLIF
jgi:hypothetical protein